MQRLADNPSALAIAPQRAFQPISAFQARRARFQHNAVSAVAAPLNLLGRQAVAGSFGILMYHRVTPNPANHFRPTYSVTPRRFESQLRSLLDQGFCCWSLQRVLATLEGGGVVPPKVFVVTFDDGFANNFLHALPILERLQISATVFLATAYLDSPLPFPFDQWAQGHEASIPSECWIPMTREQCHRMLDSGLVAFGAHTHTHADFRLAPEAIDRDLATCCEVLEVEFGIRHPPFSFPFGVSAMGFADPRFTAAARRVGCSCALRIDNRLVTSNDDAFAWPRFDVASGETGWTLAAKLNGWYETLRRVARGICRRGTEARS